MTIEEAARILGMKPHREVLSVVPTDEGHVVSTHDGNRTLIRRDGSLRFGVPEPVQAEERAPIRVEATVGKPRKAAKS